MKVRCVDCYEGYPTQGITLCERHQAFATLLAVAKVAATEWDDFGRLQGPLAALDDLHPGWREWT